MADLATSAAVKPPSRTALVLVDVVPPCPEDPEIFDRLGTALRVARNAGIRVVHVWSAAPGDPPPTTHPDVEPRPGEPVLPNRGLGAWTGADLGQTLVTGQIEDIVLAGRAGSPAWWPTVEEVSAQPLAVQVLSDRKPEHDLRARGLLERGAGLPGGRLVDVGAWVAGAGRHARSRFGRIGKRRALLSCLAVALVVVVGGGVLVDRQAKAYYEFSPGSAPAVTASADCKVRGSSSDLSLANGTSCARLIVPADRAHPVSGKLFMVDVLVGPASPVDYALHELHLLDRLRSGNQLVPASAVLGTTPAGQLGCQDAQQMSGSTQDAAVAALDRLGYGVTENHLGAQILQVSPGSAAQAGGLRCNDVVTAVDATPVHTADDLVRAVHVLRPGARAVLEVERTGANGVRAKASVTATLTGTPPTPATDGFPPQAAKPDVAFLGVESQTQVTYRLPFDVSIQVGDIGGPSAGLALTLGLLDVLSNGHLTGGHYVAATGTIATDGTVGDVGGVAQKTIAVRRAGAQVFLVPPQEYAAARSQAGSTLKVLPVSTLNQALADLEGLGGSLGALPPAAATTPPTAP